MLSCLQKFSLNEKYGWQRNCILQDFTGLEILISMKANKTKNRFQTGFNNQNPVCKIPSINLHKSN